MKEYFSGNGKRLNEKNVRGSSEAKGRHFSMAKCVILYSVGNRESGARGQEFSARVPNDGPYFERGRSVASKAGLTTLLPSSANGRSGMLKSLRHEVECSQWQGTMKCA